MAENEGLKDLLKKVVELTEKIDQGSVHNEVSNVFKKKDTKDSESSSSSTSGASGFERSRYRRLMNMRKIGTNLSKRRPDKRNTPFMCDMVLLAGPKMTSVPKQRAKLTLIEKGHILSACQFDKSMTEVQVQSSIIEMLGDKLPSNVDIEILMSAHNKLVKPTLPPGQGINGVILHRLFKTKPIYVLPDRQLIKARIFLFVFVCSFVFQ